MLVLDKVEGVMLVLDNAESEIARPNQADGLSKPTGF